MSENFATLCRLSQDALKEYVANSLNETHKSVVVGDGYVFAQGTFPVLLVAHLDTVHEELPYIIMYDKERDAIFSPTGIGGDDRCGVYMILEIIRKYNCSVLFCEDEEIGGVGAREFANSELSIGLKFNYIIEFDRMGSNDAVFYQCDNPDFTSFITREFYNIAIGSFSDISIVAPALGCAAVNLSCGYYNAHTTEEYVVMEEMNASINAACKILERTTEDDKFEYIESEYDYSDYYGGYGNLESYYIISYIGCKNQDHCEYYDTWALSKYEAIGRFLHDNPDITYNDVIEVYCDDTM